MSNLEYIQIYTINILIKSLQSIYKDCEIYKELRLLTDEYFYYDVYIPNVNISSKILDRIESKMREIINQESKIADVNQTNNIFKNIPNKIYFQLLETNIVTNNAYPGIEFNRIYGTVWHTKNELEDYILLRKKRLDNSHIELGSKLNLFFIDDKNIGVGLPILKPKGAMLRRIIEDYTYKVHSLNDYNLVNTPHIAKEQLYAKSGHLDWYKEFMYPKMHVNDNHNYYIKPMSCPMHALIYNSELRSYRDLPLRLFESASVYRYELSGVLQGLTRVRGMTQDDAHIFCTFDQIEVEIEHIINLTLFVLKQYGFKRFEFELSKQDIKKSIGSNEEWEESTNILYSIANKLGIAIKEEIGGAAFYGPKLSINMWDSLNRVWQLSTLQLDFQLPKRFNLFYKNKDGQQKPIFMIHRAIYGSIERFMGLLIEHYNARFPLWLAPVQVMGISITRDTEDYLKGIIKELKINNIRCDIDKSYTRRLSQRIYRNELELVPYIIIIGKDDVKNNTLSIRITGSEGKVINNLEIRECIKLIQNSMNIKYVM